MTKTNPRPFGKAVRDDFALSGDAFNEAVGLVRLIIHAALHAERLGCDATASLLQAAIEDLKKQYGISNSHIFHAENDKRH